MVDERSDEREGVEGVELVRIVLLQDVRHENCLYGQGLVYSVAKETAETLVAAGLAYFEEDGPPVPPEPPPREKYLPAKTDRGTRRGRSGKPPKYRS